MVEKEVRPGQLETPKAVLNPQMYNQILTKALADGQQWYSANGANLKTTPSVEFREKMELALERKLSTQSIPDKDGQAHYIDGSSERAKAIVTVAKYYTALHDGKTDVKYPLQMNTIVPVPVATPHLTRQELLARDARLHEQARKRGVADDPGKYL